MARSVTKGFSNAGSGKTAEFKPATSPERDSMYKSLAHVLGMVRLDPDKLKKEVKAIHKARRSRILMGTNVTGESLSRAAREDGARRSRLVEIASDCRDSRNGIAKVYDSVHLHVSAVYGKTHFTEHRTIAERQNAVYNLPSFVLATDMLASIDSVIELANYAIEDIDKSGFSLSLSMRALELGARGKDF